MTRPSQQVKRVDRELNAMRFNLKEQRVLQKNLHILDAEASYSLKLIDLDNRGVKVFYKRFKDKVSKIKSHLRAEEIAELRDLESRGEMKDISKPLNITGALRIADAEKRLNLRGHERSQRKTKSAFAKRSETTASVDSLTSRDRPISTSAVHVHISQPTLNDILEVENSSLNSAFVSASDKLSNKQRKNSMDIIPSSNEPTTQIQHSDNLYIEGKSTNISTKCSRRLSGKSLKSLQDQMAWEQNTANNDSHGKRSHNIQPDTSSAVAKVRDAHASSNSKTWCKNGDVTASSDSKAAHKVKVLDTNTSAEVLAVSRTGGTGVRPNSLSVPKVGDAKQFSECSSTKRRPSLTVSFANEMETKCDKLRPSTNYSEIQTPDTPVSRSRSRNVISRSSNQTRCSSRTSSSVSFSCHSNADRESTGETSGMKTATLYSSDDDAMSPYLGENPFEERRKMLLYGEQNKAETLAEKKDNFLDRVDEYIKVYRSEAAPVVINDPIYQAEMEELGLSAELLDDETPTLTRAQIRMLKNQQKMQEQFLQRKKSSKEVWKDINKCAYLRVPEDKIDLSGIVTLATEQMKLFKTLRPM